MNIRKSGRESVCSFFLGKKGTKHSEISVFLAYSRLNNTCIIRVSYVYHTYILRVLFDGGR